MERMNVDITQIEAVVISHDHWDHIDGLWDILKKRPDIIVYLCPGFSSECKKKIKNAGGRIVESSYSMKIGENVFLTGEIASIYKNEYMPEQSLIIKKDKGITVITGCAHPGIVRIVDRVIELFPDEHLHMIAGGFHLKDTNEMEIKHIINEFKKRNIDYVAPAHCTGEEAVRLLKETYGERFLSVRAGETIHA
jgi:7,8-dihydropterin-6-yl-methyl-4-(beta-D-ribofuranosyl)aminobenzene 5'-phosphate synthase